MARIFVIDDDEQLLRMVGLMLKRGGHEAILVSNPEDGVEKIKAEPPDMLIVDVMMPGMSGHEVCSALRAHEATKALPIMTLTARSQEVDRQTALQSGADDFLSKPVTSQELLDRVNDLLNRPQAPGVGSKQPMVIAVFGLQGGVGRTTLAVNLAASLHSITKESVCLVDFSTSGGQAALHLRMQPRGGWSELLSDGSLSWSAVEQSMMTHESGLKILAAPAMPIAPTTPTTEMTKALLAELRANVLFTIVDLPPVLSASFKATMAFADMALHVLSPDIVSVQTAVRADRALKSKYLMPSQCSHVLNQVLPQSQLPKSTVEKGLNTRIPFHITYDANQLRALSQGTPLVLGSSQSPLTIVVRRMAEALQQKVTAA